MRLITDIFHCQAEAPIGIPSHSGYVSGGRFNRGEVAFTMANAIAYVQQP
jgi:hypothetical protein